MSYQALLFCPDDRLARVVTQVFSELDFTVELVNEPFAAVKKLMAQRYDAVVVDCENEPNATLLFKSARNSSSNQSSLALALVEGQAGVAKAYRIGANLVLTKPINVEQAKGTLRVARGLLRKHSDTGAASPAAPAKAAPAPTPAQAPAPVAFKAAIPSAPPVQSVKTAPAQSGYEHNEFESEAELPAMAASAKADDAPVAAPVAEAKTKISVDDAPARNTLPSSLFEAAQPTAPAFKSPAATPALSGAAAAPAPARESAVPVEIKPAVTPAEPAAGSDSSFAASAVGSSPSFSALENQDSDGSGGNKKLLLVAAAVLIAAALGYFGYTKFGRTSSTAQPASRQQTPISATPSVPATSLPSGSPAESVPSSSQQSVASGSISKPSASINTPSVAINSEPEVITKKIAPAIVVKSNSSAKPAASPGEEAAPQVPNPLAVATASNKNLSGLVSSVPSALPTATLGTLKISQGVSQGLLIKRVQPRYPQTALSMRVQGAVQMEATINKEGNITNLKVVSGDAVLAHAASEAVRQWRYKPYYLNGEPVDIQTQITVNFKLPN